MGLKVIGAGFGRTGTDSMKRALEMLGFSPCHHMYEVLPRQDLYDAWVDVLNGDREPDWDRIFDGFEATVDWPSAHYWRELAAHFPEARILLTVRSAESWLASMDKTILNRMRPENDPTPMALALRARIFDDRIDDPEHIVAIYRRQIEEVQAAFGPDRLLTYDLGSGWEPLCAFLGVPVPDTPFPRGNTAEDFQVRADQTRAEQTAIQREKG